MPLQRNNQSVPFPDADGAANTVRPTGITYPDGTTTITTAYGGTAANALSRPDALKEGSATLCSYRYLGSGVVIGVKYNAAGNVELTFRDGGTGDGGDPYTGLDRFGRLIETVWKKGSADRVRSQYKRNRFGGITWRRDDQAHAQGVDTEDNYYAYDGLYQVQERQRGNLTGTAPDYTGITNLQQEEDWTYDQTGNWAAYDNTSPANAQTRTHNTANEITQIAASVGNVNPAYDPAGNMLTLPKQPGISTGQSALKWDAWNRLVSVKDGSTSVASYTYDGLTRRLSKTNPAEVRHYYYNIAWRAVEERVEGASISVDRQYTWGLRDRWDLLRRKRSVSGTLDESLNVLRDYLDPVAIVDDSGAVVERYAYDAFGNARYLAPDFSSRSSSVFGWDFLFHTEFLDEDTRLYNYGYRYYSPNLGRWVSVDPIGETGGKHLYGFLGNSPTNTWDYLGLREPTTAEKAVLDGLVKAAAAVTDLELKQALPKVKQEIANKIRALPDDNPGGHDLIAVVGGLKRLFDPTPAEKTAYQDWTLRASSTSKYYCSRFIRAVVEDVYSKDPAALKFTSKPEAATFVEAADFYFKRDTGIDLPTVKSPAFGTITAGGSPGVRGTNMAHVVLDLGNGLVIGHHPDPVPDEYRGTVNINGKTVAYDITIRKASRIAHYPKVITRRIP